SDSRTPLWIAGFLFVTMLVQGGLATRGVTVCPDGDHARDFGRAHTMLAGRWREDPNLLGEVAWYPPGLSATIAACSWLRHKEPESLFVGLGLVLNLLAPLGLLVLGMRFFGRWVGVAGLLLFSSMSRVDVASWVEPTFSPWLYPYNVAEGLYLFGLLVLFKL